MTILILLLFRFGSALQQASLRVMVADIGNEIAWYPGDRRLLKSPTPSQQSALSVAAMEELVMKRAPAVRGDSAIERPLVVVVPAVENHFSMPETHTHSSQRSNSMASPAASSRARDTKRIAALCAVSRIKAGGKARVGASIGVDMQISSAILEVVGRVAIDRVEAAGDDGLVADNAVVDDAWIDELHSSPVHVLHSLRPHADECARLHEVVRSRYDLEVDLDRPLFEIADAAAENAAKIYSDMNLRDAYGDVIIKDPEIETLRAVSFAAWRVLRCFPETETGDIAWAFHTRSTLDRLRKAEELLREILVGA